MVNSNWSGAAFVLHAEHLAGPMDVESFKFLLVGCHKQIYRQCQQAAKAFAISVKYMAVKGMLSPCAEEEVANELWVACGYDEIMDTISTVIMQVLHLHYILCFEMEQVLESFSMCLPSNEYCCFVAAFLGLFEQ